MICSVGAESHFFIATDACSLMLRSLVQQARMHPMKVCLQAMAYRGFFMVDCVFRVDCSKTSENRPDSPCQMADSS